GARDRLAARRDQRDAGMHLVAAAGKEREKAPRLGLAFRFAKRAATDRDDGIGGEKEFAAMAVRDGPCFLLGETGGEMAGQFAPRRALINLGRIDGIGADADLLEQLKPPRRCRCQDKFGSGGQVRGNLMTRWSVAGRRLSGVGVITHTRSPYL